MVKKKLNACDTIINYPEDTGWYVVLLSSSESLSWESWEISTTNTFKTSAPSSGGWQYHRKVIILAYVTFNDARNNSAGRRFQKYLSKYLSNNVVLIII